MRLLGTIAMLLLLVAAVACSASTEANTQPNTTVGGVQIAPIEEVRDYHHYLEY